MRLNRSLLICLTLVLAAGRCAPTAFSDPPPKLRRWLQPQNWVRDTRGPVISLGRPGAFDGKHLFAPCVIRENDRYRMWYSGSQGTVANRVFRLGLATSRDGKAFVKFAKNPVFGFGDGKHSVLTAAVLRRPDGSVLREDGKLRLWFSSTHFAGKSGRHTLHTTASKDGVHWEKPSAALLEGVYAPTVIREKDRYRMWFTDVSSGKWTVSHAESRDGQTWKITHRGLLKVDQKWETSRLFYPAVLKVDGVYLMWYGSYWRARRHTTALGLAASLDGLRWFKNPHNPVFRPDPEREWESHYTTSQSVLRLPDGSFRLWYASRKKPPFVNKYFAIGTARWAGPKTANQE